VRKQNVTQIDSRLVPLCFSEQEQHLLRQLRADYPVRRDFLGAGELEHLRFIRWLYRTGRLNT
jgi:hypothetical protein